MKLDDMSNEQIEHFMQEIAKPIYDAFLLCMERQKKNPTLKFLSAHSYATLVLLALANLNISCLVWLVKFYKKRLRREFHLEILKSKLLFYLNEQLKLTI